ncbi:MAG TPA: hypothetical protein VM287_04510 [Egibacteraceae bacterium]|nr:hypothetical protein [Egibacteraceae bacterium]
MSGPLGVMSVLLLEAAVGGAVVLWASGVWGSVRRGFFLLMGAVLALSAVGAWTLTRGQSVGREVTALGLFAALLVVWQVLLILRQEMLSRAVGLAGAAIGVAALVLFGVAHGTQPALAVAELALGALFLGSTLFGLLLGHWYLVERRLSNAYMIRSAWWYIAGVVAAVGAAILSAQNPPPEMGGGFSPVLGVPGFSVMLAVGLVGICALIAGFVWKLAQEGGRSIQAATGMFYLAVIMAFSAELSTKFRFF